MGFVANGQTKTMEKRTIKNQIVSAIVLILLVLVYIFIVRFKFNV